MRSMSSIYRWCLAATIGGSMLLGTTITAQEQPRPQPQPGPGGTGGGEGQQADLQQRINDFRKRADDRMKTLLQASDEEYAVLKPRIEKLQGLQMASDTRMMGFGMLMGGGGQQTWRSRASDVPEGQRQERKPEEGAQPARPAGALGGIMSMFGVTSAPAMDKAREIQQALDAKDVTPDVLKSKLAELRALRKQAKEEITRAQEELRQLCSIRQETVLVLMGILE